MYISWLYQVKLYLRSCQDHGKENVFYYLAVRSWVKQKATSSGRWLVVHRFFTRTQLYINNIVGHTKHKFSNLIFFVEYFLDFYYPRKCWSRSTIESGLPWSGQTEIWPTQSQSDPNIWLAWVIWDRNN